MLCLSVKQPWAALIVQGTKNIENRDWYTDYRGPLLIHAGKTFDPHAFDWLEQHLSADEKRRLPRKDEYQRGGIVGVVRLVDVVTSSESRWFQQGKYGWCFNWA